MNGPGTVTFVSRSVAARRNLRGARARPASPRRIGPVHQRHRRAAADPVDASRRRRSVVDAVERVGEVVEVALATDLAVGDDVDPGPLLVVDGQQRRRVERLVELLGRRSATRRRRGCAARPSRPAAIVIDQPRRLRVAADDGGGKHWQRRHTVASSHTVRGRPPRPERSLHRPWARSQGSRTTLPTA